MEHKIRIFTVLALAAAFETGTGTLMDSAQGAQLWDQEFLVSHPGGGFGGADASVSTNCRIGYQANGGLKDSVIEDFVINNLPSASGWLVNEVRLYAFDCNEDQPPPPLPTSTITEAYAQIWDGVPYSGGASVIRGDLVTDVLSSTSFFGYREPNGGPLLQTSWPIFECRLTVSWFLPENATYYIEWGFDTSGSVCPNQPAVPANPGRPGNALTVLDGIVVPTKPQIYGCVGNPQNACDELPFQLYGEPVGDPSHLDPMCITLPNSTGNNAELMLIGTGIAGDEMRGGVTGGPAANFGYFLSGPNPGLYIVPPGSQGIICLGGPQYRYISVPLGHLFQFDATGTSQAIAGGGLSILQTDGSYAPVPAVMAGDSRYFQAWYRDGASSNFSTSRGLTFL